MTIVRPVSRVTFSTLHVGCWCGVADVTCDVLHDTRDTCHWTRVTLTPRPPPRPMGPHSSRLTEYSQNNATGNTHFQ